VASKEVMVEDLGAWVLTIFLSSSLDNRDSEVEKVASTFTWVEDIMGITTRKRRENQKMNFSKTQT
jgi:hypothetical protein